MKRSLRSLLLAAVAPVLGAAVLSGCYYSAPPPRQVYYVQPGYGHHHHHHHGHGHGHGRPVYVQPAQPARPVYVQPAQPGRGRPTYVQPAPQQGRGRSGRGR
jgi:hypothetical protein